MPPALCLMQTSQRWSNFIDYRYRGCYGLAQEWLANAENGRPTVNRANHRHSRDLGPWVAPLVHGRGGDYLPTVPSVHRAVRAVGDHPVEAKILVRFLHLLFAQ